MTRFLLLVLLTVAFFAAGLLFNLETDPASTAYARIAYLTSGFFGACAWIWAGILEFKNEEP